MIAPQCLRTQSNRSLFLFNLNFHLPNLAITSNTQLLPKMIYIKTNEIGLGGAGMRTMTI